jgi:2-oxoisovalerate dehydrogenase E1 component alpha subunit
MPSFGETVATVASAATVENEDLMFLQGAMLWRGMNIKSMTDQCSGNHIDLGKGRQMPVHYCAAKELNVFSISSHLSK